MSGHKFHIPVMGIGFTVDSPIKVAQYGISSVISMVDDILFEKMREFYCKKFTLPFKAIEKSDDDYRAKRVTAYLNTVNEVVADNFKKLKDSAFDAGSEITKYFEMLPDHLPLKKEYQKMVSAPETEDVTAMQKNLRDSLVCGSIDVNIMTKLDKANYKDGEELSDEYRDAHAALRGFVKSDVAGSIVLSAGMNKKLYGYMASFDEFQPNAEGEFNKKIVIKVSDYRSALTQGKFLAKKGLWVSEFRVESGLNCGGHAFATQGILMGPILEEFRQNYKELVETLQDMYNQTCAKNGNAIQENPLNIKFTVQGGVGTAEEHAFLCDYYGADSVGWGTPFLFSPEVTNVDSETLETLCNAKEEDLYLSDISPLGVKFNNLKGNSKDRIKDQFIAEGRPGSNCPKRYLVSNTEFSEKPICTASRQYQKSKIEELEAAGLSEAEYQKNFDKIVEKSCICVGLGTPALMINDLDMKLEGEGVSICPGPNAAYYNTKPTLAQMVNHIYGRGEVPVADHRPHMFLKELDMYLDHFKELIDAAAKPLGGRDLKSLQDFRNNVQDGFNYYKELVTKFTGSMQKRVSEGLVVLEDKFLTLAKEVA